MIENRISLNDCVILFHSTILFHYKNSSQLNQLKEENRINVIADSINPTNILKGIEDTISDVAHEIIPDCIFGVQSVSMVLYTKWVLFLQGANILLQWGNIYFAYIKIFGYFLFARRLIIHLFLPEIFHMARISA